MTSKADVLSEVFKYDYLRFSICDIQGNCRGVVKPCRHAVSSVEKGVDMYQGLILSWKESVVDDVSHTKSYNYGSMTIIPDLNTLRAIPWAADGQYKVGEFLCESRWRKDGSPQKACPRYVARQQLQRLDDLGLQLFSGFEMDYLLFDAKTMLPVFQGNEYASHTVQNRFSSLMFKFEQMMYESGIDIADMHNEVSPGEFETVLSAKYGIESADAAFNFKQGIRELAEINSLQASFMTKMDLSELSNGIHFNHSIQSKSSGSMSEYILFDSQAEDKLSTTAKRWIAGILKHGKALSALCAPTPNCFRRIHESWAPSSIFWGLDDREALLRARNHEPAHTYFENRLPSGLCNPYIVLAATVAAGLDGIINKLECPPPGTLKDSEPLPQTFEEALEALGADTELGKALGEEFVEWFLVSRKAEVRYFESVKTDNEKLALERKRYF